MRKDAIGLICALVAGREEGRGTKHDLWGYPYRVRHPPPMCNVMGDDLAPPAGGQDATTGSVSVSLTTAHLNNPPLPLSSLT